MNVVEEPKVCPITIMSSCPLLRQPGEHLMSYLRHIKRARKSNVLKRSGIWFHIGTSRIAASRLHPETLLSAGLQVPLCDLQAPPGPGEWHGRVNEPCTNHSGSPHPTGWPSPNR